MPSFHAEEDMTANIRDRNLDEALVLIERHHPYLDGLRELVHFAAHAGLMPSQFGSKLPFWDFPDVSRRILTDDRNY